MSLSTVRKQILEAKEEPGAPMPCWYCKATTPHETLRIYGRCKPCFDSYCRQTEPVRNVPQSVIDGNANLRWARILRWRSENGERLSEIQNSAWRKALRVV